MRNNIATARNLTTDEIGALFSLSAAREFNYFWGLRCISCGATANVCLSTSNLQSIWTCAGCDFQNALTSERPRPPVHDKPAIGPSKALINSVLQKLWMVHLFH